MSDDLVAICEALLFVAGDPLTLPELAAAAEVDEGAVQEALAELERRLAERGAGVVLDRTGPRLRPAGRSRRPRPRRPAACRRVLPSAG